jgi:hypothetical protein
MAEITIQLKKVKKLTVQTFFPSASCLGAFCLLVLAADCSRITPVEGTLLSYHFP